ncbi:MAG: hypothetical protein AVDCRST_MAG18-4733, partial [uncultured Thermomicrobiales bacterium]
VRNDDGKSDHAGGGDRRDGRPAVRGSGRPAGVSDPGWGQRGLRHPGRALQAPGLRPGVPPPRERDRCRGRRTGNVRARLHPSHLLSAGQPIRFLAPLDHVALVHRLPPAATRDLARRRGDRRGGDALTEQPGGSPGSAGAEIRAQARGAGMAGKFAGPVPLGFGAALLARSLLCRDQRDDRPAGLDDPDATLPRPPTPEQEPRDQQPTLPGDGAV